MILDPALHQVAIIAALAAAMASFAWEKVSLEATSLALIVGLLVWFSLFPVPGARVDNLLSPRELLAGFANPTLIAVLALIVMGQGMVQTGALNNLTSLFVGRSRALRVVILIASLLAVGATSAFLNNTPVVVMFIPIMQALAQRLRLSASRLMMPLSFIAILGGMTTLIGSSTNLLVSGALGALGRPELAIFDVTALALPLAALGAVYVAFVLPYLLPRRRGMAETLRTEGRQFIAEIDIAPDSALVGEKAVAGHFRALPDITVRRILRDGDMLLPPYDDVILRLGDRLIVAATRDALAEALARHGGFLFAGGEPATASGRPDTDHVLAEAMVAPASRMVDLSVDTAGFSSRFGLQVLGIQRRGRMASQRIGEIRVLPGDVLLLSGRREAVNALRANPDLVLMTWAIRDLPRLRRAPYAIAVFLGTVALVSTGLLPIATGALLGVGGMIATGCLNIRQATRAIDRTVLLLVGATLGLSTAMQETGAAETLAMAAIGLVGDGDVVTAMIVLFVVVAIATNMLSNNACAVLFTPIAVELALIMGAPVVAFALTVLIAANCSFATPIGYQTNLLVMGPGHYRFRDFLRGGGPLVVLMCVGYALYAPWYFSLG